MLSFCSELNFVQKKSANIYNFFSFIFKNVQYFPNLKNFSYLITSLNTSSILWNRHEVKTTSQIKEDKQRPSPIFSHNQRVPSFSKHSKFLKIRRRHSSILKWAVLSSFKSNIKKSERYLILMKFMWRAEVEIYFIEE